MTIRDAETMGAGLVDRLRVGIAPLLLGRGERLWADLRACGQGYAATSEVAPSGTIHTILSR